VPLGLNELIASRSPSARRVPNHAAYLQIWSIIMDSSCQRRLNSPARRVRRSCGETSAAASLPQSASRQGTTKNTIHSRLWVTGQGLKGSYNRCDKPSVGRKLAGITTGRGRCESNTQVVAVDCCCYLRWKLSSSLEGGKDCGGSPHKSVTHRWLCRVVTPPHPQHCPQGWHAACCTRGPPRTPGRPSGCGAEWTPGFCPLMQGCC